MRRLVLASFFASSLLCAAASAADTPACIGPHIDGKTQNYGVETWQMMKVADDKWRIASVMWTMNRLPAPTSKP